MRTLGEESLGVHVLTLASGMQKIRHAAENQEFSALVSPLECDALLDHIERLEDNARNWRELVAAEEGLV